MFCLLEKENMNMPSKKINGSKKFHYAPFGIDLNFWKNNKKILISKIKKGFYLLAMTVIEVLRCNSIE